jgi:guanine nucleotide-binding protein G(i) subunit alpha
MDPASILGIIGSVISIADIVTRSVRRLSSLKTKFKDVPFLVTTLTGQLCTVQAALDQLSVWAKRDLNSNDRYKKLATQVGDALECFGPLIKALESRLDQIEGVDQGESQNNTAKRLFFLWTERELMDYLSLLDRQVNALTLLLQALQW